MIKYKRRRSKGAEELVKWLLEKYEEPRNHHNEHTLDYSKGYKKAVYDMLEIIENIGVS